MLFFVYYISNAIKIMRIFIRIKLINDFLIFKVWVIRIFLKYNHIFNILSIMVFVHIVSTIHMLCEAHILFKTSIVFIKKGCGC